MNEGCTIDGLTQTVAAIQRLPDTVTLALKRVAQGSANQIALQARTRLLSPSPAFKRPGPGYGILASGILAREDLPNRQYVVACAAPPGYPANLPIWVEFGTIHMPARPFMGPAARAESASYVSAVEAAAVDVVRQALEG